jgi:hypothetical protein
LPYHERVKRILTASACLLLSLPGLGRAQGYNGVVPGSAAVPEHLAAAPGGAPVVTWPGFQMTADGGSRVFVQTTHEAKPELKREGGNVVVVIPGVSLPPGNSRLPLDTHFFNTPLQNARLKPRDGGVSIVLELRPGSNVTPTLRTEKAPNGYYFVYVEFPPGTYL